MKKITLSLFTILVAISTQAQISSGEIMFVDGYTAEIDIDETDIVLTLVGEEDRYLAIGFGVNGMDAGGDVVSFDATGFNDRAFLGIGIPPTLDTQDWAIVSNEVEAGIRTLIVTRPLAGSDATDYEFSADETSLDLVWARGNTLNFQNHTTQNRGSTTINFTLGVDANQVASIVSLYPVPARDFITVSLQNIAIENTNLTVYTITGEQVLSIPVDHKSMLLDTSTFAQGVYIVRIQNPAGVLTTQFIKR